jgi:hypothetical protein
MPFEQSSGVRATPVMANAVTPQSRSAMFRGVPSKTDIVILSTIASLGRDAISGTSLIGPPPTGRALTLVTGATFVLESGRLSRR